VVFGSFLGVAVCSTPVAVLSLGAYIKPFNQTFGWGRGAVSLALTLILLVMAAATPFVGKLIDRLGVRPVLIASLASYGLAMAAIPSLVQLAGLPGLYVGYALVGILGAGSNTIAYSQILSGWFDRKRGAALGIGMSGFALGAAATPALTSVLIARYGWSAGFYGLALLPLVVGLPAAFWLIKEAPQSDRPKIRAVADNTDVRAAIRTPAFWTLAAVFLLATTCINGIQIHLLPLTTDHGFGVQTGATAVAILFVASAVARAVAGFLLDMAFAPFVGAALLATACVGAFMLIFAPTLSVLYLAAALLGVGSGAETDLLGYLVSRYFPRQAFGAIYGMIFGAFMVGSAIGPSALGYCFDLTGSYNLALATTGAGLALACALLFTLPPFGGERRVRAVPI
jgi:MFS family permease